MHRFPVRQEDDPQNPAIGLLDGPPATDAPIGLQNFANRIPDRAFDPLHPDPGPIRSLPHGEEVLRAFHGTSLTGKYSPI
jgi:hypothetical protein